MIQFQDGSSARVPELATLQRWVVEGKVDRQDYVSSDGITLTPAENLTDLKPFFNLVQKVSESQVGSGTGFPAANLNRQTAEYQKQAGQSGGYSYSQDQQTEYSVQSASYGSMPSHAGMNSQPSMPHHHVSVSASGLQPQVGNHPSRASMAFAAPHPSSSEQIPIVTDNHPPFSTSGEWFHAGEQGTASSMQPSVSGEWNRGTSPSFGSLASVSHSGTNFNNYSVPMSQELDSDLRLKESSGLGWLWILLVLLIAGGGAAFYLKPDWFRLSEAKDEALATIRNSVNFTHRFNATGFRGRNQQLQRARSEEGRDFPTLLAAQADLSLAQTHYTRLQLELNRQRLKKLLLEEKKQQTTLAELAKSKAKDKKEQEEKLKKAMVALKARKTALKKQQQKLIVLESKHLGNASKALSQPLVTQNATHPQVMLTRLQLLSLRKKDQKEYNQLLASINKAKWSNKTSAVASVEFSKGLAMLNSAVKDQWQKAPLAFKKAQDNWKLDTPNMTRMMAAWAYTQSENWQEAAKLLKKVDTQLARQLEKVVLVKWKAKQEADRKKAIAFKAAQAKKKAATTGKGKAGTRKASKPLKLNSYRGLYRYARRSYSRGRYSVAVKYYNKALEKKKSVAAYTGLGWALMEVSKGEAAAKNAFLKAVKLGGSASSLYGLGLSYRRLNKNKQAKRYLKQYISRYPSGKDASEIKLILKSL
jgi:tetratricopeptide (TPR) repeat protein